MGRSNQRRIDPEVIKQARRRSLKRMARIITFGLAITATAGTGVWLNQRWSVTQWDIQAEAPIKAAINRQLEAMERRDFISTQPQQLKEQWLSSIPDLAAVRITRVLPDSLQIQADERVPAALWQDEQGRLHLFDADGIAYRPLKKGESPDLPLLRTTQAQLQGAQQILMSLAKLDVKTMHTLSEIRAGTRHWQIYFSRGVSWLIPQGNEVAAIDKITSLLEQPRWAKRNWRVDARLEGRWFIRPVGHGRGHGGII